MRVPSKGAQDFGQYTKQSQMEETERRGDALGLEFTEEGRVSC